VLLDCTKDANVGRIKAEFCHSFGTFFASHHSIGQYPSGRNFLLHRGDFHTYLIGERGLFGFLQKDDDG